MLQQPRERDLTGGRTVAARDFLQRTIVVWQPPVGERIEREEREPVALAVFYDRLRRSIGDVVVILDADDWHDGSRTLDLVNRKVRHANVADFARVAQFS